MPTVRKPSAARTSAIALGIASLLFAGACSNTTDRVGDTNSEESASGSVIGDSLDDELVTPGVLTVAIFDTSPPGSFYAEDGRLIGWEVELAGNLADQLGLDIDFIGGSFDSVLGAVESGAADIGIASIFDTRERQQRVDFVEYFVGGTSWAVASGSDFNPIDPCGSRVGALEGSAQLIDYLPRLSEQCVGSGAEAIEAVSYEAMTTAASDTTAGVLDAIVADDPVVAYLASQSFGRLRVPQTYIEAQPYGIASPKGKVRLTRAIQSALDASREDRFYRNLLGRWGLQAGAVADFTSSGIADPDQE